MTSVVRRARPADLDRDQRLLLAYVADEYAEGFVVDQFPEYQGGEQTGWDQRDVLCLTALAGRLRRRLRGELHLTDRERTLLCIAASLFADEYPDELTGAIGGEDDIDELERSLRAAHGELIAGTDTDALFTAKGL